MSNGFLMSSPTARHGTVNYPGVQGHGAQRFTCPGFGAIQIFEIGTWIYADAATTAVFHLGIFTDDAVNTCPETIVANSDTGELSTASTTIVKVSFPYVTKPQLNGGTPYWLCLFLGDSNGNYDGIATGGISLTKTSAVYPTWPTGVQWESNTPRTRDLGTYAVYRTARMPTMGFVNFQNPGVV